ncbi:MAG TPA: SDR family oxidoreductase [Dehalococcoidales bacterium]|nr:SDR family oxidoreductase [Dehalococcoidales bacterium]
MPEILDTAPLAMNKTGLNMKSLAGEVAVVTGATSNIGLATARSLAWLGAKIVIAARNPDKGLAAEALINRETQPGTALFVSTDVADEASMKNMAARAFDRFGKVDILVNNAMDMTLAGPILKSTAQQLDRQYEIAVRGAFWGIQLFVPEMQKRRHGTVTYISTTFRYPAGPSNYCAVKAAAQSMMMSLAAELGPVEKSGVAVFTYIPGLVGRFKPDPDNLSKRSFVVPPSMPGYPGAYPPEDCAAALAYSITRARDLHGSGIIITQAFEQMDWPYPVPETAHKKDFDRIREAVQVRMFAYLGPGFPARKKRLVSVNRSDAPPDENIDNSALK